MADYKAVQLFFKWFKVKTLANIYTAIPFSKCLNVKNVTDIYTAIRIFKHKSLWDSGRYLYSY